MNRREFSLLSLAGLAAASLPKIVEAAPAKPQTSARPLERTYVAAVGGRPIYITGRSVGKSTSKAVPGVSGVVIAVAGVLRLHGESKLYLLHHCCFDPVLEGEKIREMFARYTAGCSPVERFYEAGGLLEPLLDQAPYPTRVQQAAAERPPSEEEMQAAVSSDKVLPYKVVEFAWREVGAIEPSHGNIFRELFPSRKLYGKLEGERLEVLQGARALADIHRRFLKSQNLPDAVS
jgi:hypothetical protein